MTREHSTANRQSFFGAAETVEPRAIRGLHRPPCLYARRFTRAGAARDAQPRGPLRGFGRMQKIPIEIFVLLGLEHMENSIDIAENYQKLLAAFAEARQDGSPTEIL